MMTGAVNIRIQEADFDVMGNRPPKQ